jgi:hypothetical protein
MTTLVLPAPKDVRDLLEDLLGKDVTVGTGEPVRVADLPRMVVAVYVTDGLRMTAVAGLDLGLAAYAGAALGLVPVGGANACIEDRELSPMLGENVGEICNVLSALLNREGAPHVRHYGTYLVGQPPPADAAAHLMALGQRLDLNVDVAGYGSGTLSIALA